MNIKVVGVDLAKNVFQICVWLDDGSVAWNRKVVRSKLLIVIRQFPDGTLIAMEASATAHHWGVYRSTRRVNYLTMPNASND